MNITSFGLFRSRGLRFTSASCLLLTLAIAPGCGVAYAQDPPKAVYQQKKKVEFSTARLAGAQTIKVTHFEHAWYKKGEEKESNVNPAQPDPDKFDKFGYERLQTAPPENTSSKPDAKGSFPSGATYNPVTANEAIVGAAINNQTHRAQAKPTGVKAEGSVTFENIPAGPANNVYSALFRVDGFVVKEKDLEAYAFSHARMEYKDMGRNMRNEKITVTPNGSISGRAGTMFTPADKTLVQSKDPLSFTLYDANGVPLLSDTFFSTIMTAANDASVNWMDSGSLTIEAGAGGFAALHLLIDSRYVQSGQGGALDLEIENGIITQSSATGAFAGFTMPTVGSAQSSVFLSMPTSGFAIDLNLDPYLTPNVSSIGLEAANIGTAYSSSVAAPEPSGAAFLLFLTLPGAGIYRRRLRAHGKQ